MAVHVAYEWDMLVSIANRLIEGRVPGTVDDNARIESFLIHARQIYQFFFRTPDKETDVVASDYLPTWGLDHPADSAPEALKQLSKDVGERVAHLTLHRLTEANHPIPLATQQCLALIHAFRAQVPAALFPAQPTVSLAPAWAARPASVYVTGTTTTSGLG